VALYPVGLRVTFAAGLGSLPATSSPRATYSGATEIFKSFSAALELCGGLVLALRGPDGPCLLRALTCTSSQACYSAIAQPVLPAGPDCGVHTLYRALCSYSQGKPVSR